MKRIFLAVFILCTRLLPAEADGDSASNSVSDGGLYYYEYNYAKNSPTARIVDRTRRANAMAFTGFFLHIAGIAMIPTGIVLFDKGWGSGVILICGGIAYFSGPIISCSGSNVSRNAYIDEGYVPPNVDTWKPYFIGLGLSAIPALGTILGEYFTFEAMVNCMRFTKFQTKYFREIGLSLDIAPQYDIYSRRVGLKANVQF